MKYEIYLLMLLAGVMILGGVLHFAYLNRIKSRVRKTAGSKIEMSDLKNALQTSQGSNFNTFVLSTWSLFFVAVVFLYFLTPAIFPNLNYFRISQVASYDFGLAALGATAIVFMGALAAFRIPMMYRYYAISKSTKEAIIYIAPLLLIASLLASTYLGTVYPSRDENIWNLGYITLFASMILLLMPVFSGFTEELR